MTPYRLPPNSPQIPDVLNLLERSFAFMEGRIDPPSSLGSLDVGGLAQLAETGEIWCLGTPIVGCVVLHLREDALYLGKLAVDRVHRRRNLARRLVDLATQRPREHGRTALELEVRVKLVENQRAFARMGFVETARTAHPGFDRPTSVIMRRTLP